MKSIILVALPVCMVALEACIDNKVGARYTDRRVIKNTSIHQVTLRLFRSGDLNESDLSPGDSVVFSARCEVRGGDIVCGNPDYSSAFARAFEDSIHVIFNNEKRLRFIREVELCCRRNILNREEQWGYKVEGSGTSLNTYTYEITKEDYDNAEDCDEHCD